MATNLSTAMSPLDVEDITPYPVSFQSTVVALLIIENVAGLLFNFLALLMQHWSKKSTRLTVNTTSIANLNALDVVIGLSALPLTISLVLGPRSHLPLFCLLHEAFVSMASSSTAIFLIFITLDRYQTIVTPFRKVISMSNVKYIAASLWVFVLIGITLPFLVLISSPDLLEQTIARPCPYWTEKHLVSRIYFEVYHVILYFIANVVMIKCYIKIFHVARDRMSVRNAIAQAAQLARIPVRHPRYSFNGKQIDKTITKMTCMIISTFMICWAPHTALTIVSMIQGTKYPLELAQLVCLVPAYLSTVIHPILYVVMNRSFRQHLAAKWTNKVTPFILCRPLSQSAIIAMALVVPRIHLSSHGQQLKIQPLYVST